MSRVETFCKTSALKKEYQEKLVTADEAVKIVKSGDQVHYGLFGGLVRELDKALADKTIGIILLTEKFGREFPAIIDDVKLNHKTPLIIEIPDRHGTGRKPDFITSYVNEAIGLKL